MEGKKAIEEETGNKTPDAEIDKAALLGLSLQFADMVLITAPAFAEGSHGARVVAMARAFKPKLAAMLAAERAHEIKGRTTP